MRREVPNGARFLSAIALVLVGFGLGVAVTLASTHDDDARADDPGRPDEEASPGAAELYDALRDASDMTVYAKYRVEDVARPEVVSIIELWQKDGLERQDATIDEEAAADSTVSFFDLGDRVVLCQQPSGGAASCAPARDDQATTFSQLRAALLDDLLGQEVTASDDTEGREPLRCFALELGYATEVCVTEDGIVARVIGPQGSFELIDHSTNVDDAVFVLPAEPVAELPS